MLRSRTLWLVPVAIALVGSKLDIAPAIGQTTYSVNGTYDVTGTTRDIAPGLSGTIISGESADAPYGLTTVSGLTYAQFDPATGALNLNTDPTAFGLQDVPVGFIAFAGSSGNKLIGTDIATGTIDWENLTATFAGTFGITGGEGMFSGASGTLAFSEVDSLSLDPTVPTTGRATVSGSFEVIPEPEADTTMVVVCAVGASILLRRLRRKSPKKG